MFPGCGKKLLLTDMECKCTYRFCGTHRLPESHACTHDYKKEGAERLQAQLVTCVADRVSGERL
jgi:predicted nucleic acid binding AN1-type Zn finger protein